MFYDPTVSDRLRGKVNQIRRMKLQTSKAVGFCRLPTPLSGA